MNTPRDATPWQNTARAPDPEDLLAPRTQIVADRDAYLGQGRHDVGRRISDTQVELFISGDLAQSLQQEFTLHTPEFLTLHDLGSNASVKLLTNLAGAAGAQVQRLSVRRQGHGVALAVLQFVEVPLSDGTPVRVYSSDFAAEGPLRAQVARVLLANSKLGVLLVGDAPANALAGQLQPLREAMMRGPWPNRDLLLLPLSGNIALANLSNQLSGGSTVAVHVAPAANKPRQVWSYIGGAWNRLHGQPGGKRSLPTDMARAVPRPRVPRTEADTEPMDLRPMPRATPRATLPAPMPVPGATSWQDYVDRCKLIKGCVACCVFDMHSMQPLAHAGGPPNAERLAQQGVALLAQMNDASRALGLGPTRAEAAISTTTHHLILRPVPGHSGIALHLVVAAALGNLTLARMQLERIEPPQ